jgi:glutamyl-tRNA synthetase
MSKIITRYPPSPTGLPHIGTAQTALFNYMFAKKHKGIFTMRFEDTDRERSKKEFEKEIFDMLSWFKIKPDNEPYRQSERTDFYTKYMKKLIQDGLAYEAEEAKTGGGKIIRFKNPNKEVIFTDVIRGEIKFNTTELGDFVIGRNIDNPLYHLAVVADDSEAGITHVIRGEDHISNTPRQILLIDALGFERPTYAHFSLLRAKDRSKLSKRHGAVSVNDYRKLGYLPEALVNYLALAGWSSGDDREIFSLDELIEIFSLEQIQTGGAVFDIEKLNWINRKYIKNLNHRELMGHIKRYVPKDTPGYSEEVLDRAGETLRERLDCFSDLETMYTDGEIEYLFTKPKYEVPKLLWKDDSDLNKVSEYLTEIVRGLDNINTDKFTEEIIKEKIWPFAEKNGKGSVLWPMRYALSGRDKSPDPFTLSFILGKKEALERLNLGIEKVQNDVN